MCTTRPETGFLQIAGGGLRARILPFGATLAGLWLGGQPRSLVLGFSDPEAYRRERHLYMGAVIGRTANRIAHGRAPIGNRIFRLPVNMAPHHSHGGPDGFSTRTFDVEDIDESHLVLRLESPDGDQGYPGAVTVRVTYAIPSPGVLRLEFEATTTEDTLLGLCHHPYFNLGGQPDISGHILQIDASKYLPSDETVLPTGEVLPVTSTLFDFQRPRPLGPIVMAGERLNNTLVLHDAQTGPLVRAARLSVENGPTLELRTTQPGLHVYTAHKLASDEAEIDGRSLVPYAALCLEAQAWPDGANQAGFPSTLLHAGDLYRQEIEYEFSV